MHFGTNLLFAPLKFLNNTIWENFKKRTWIGWPKCIETCADHAESQERRDCYAAQTYKHQALQKYNFIFDQIHFFFSRRILLWRLIIFRENTWNHEIISSSTFWPKNNKEYWLSSLPRKCIKGGIKWVVLLHWLTI